MGKEEPLQCPACRARFREQQLCSRCGADLGPLMLLAAKAFLLRQSSRAALRSGDFQNSHKLAKEAQKLCATQIGHSLGILTSWFLLPRKTVSSLREKQLPQHHISDPEPPLPIYTPSFASTKHEKVTESGRVTRKQNIIAKLLKLIKRLLNR